MPRRIEALRDTECAVEAIRRTVAVPLLLPVAGGLHQLPRAHPRRELRRLALRADARVEGIGAGVAASCPSSAHEYCLGSRFTQASDTMAPSPVPRRLMRNTSKPVQLR